MSAVQYRLVVRRGPNPNQTFELTRDTMTIGRDITNDVVINDPEISRHHARLIRTGSGYALEDLRSTNASFVNRQRISGLQQLNNGDLIGFGETVTLAYEVVGGAAQPTIASGVPSRADAPTGFSYLSPAARLRSGSSTTNALTGILNSS